MTKEQDEEGTSSSRTRLSEMISSNSATERTSLLSGSDENDHDDKESTRSSTVHSYTHLNSNENDAGINTIKTCSTGEQEEPKEGVHYQHDEDASYVEIIRTNRPFRLYLFSYLITHAGE